MYIYASPFFRFILLVRIVMTEWTLLTSNFQHQYCDKIGGYYLNTSTILPLLFQHLSN